MRYFIFYYARRLRRASLKRGLSRHRRLPLYGQLLLQMTYVGVMLWLCIWAAQWGWR